MADLNDSNGNYDDNDEVSTMASYNAKNADLPKHLKRI